MRWLEGPPGPTEARLLERARGYRGALWWISLPAQRRYFLWRLGQGGARLGVAALHFQRVYYQAVTEAGGLRPVLGRGGRIARVAAAYRAAFDRAPSAGEAVLFTRGIAEAKRHGLGPEALPECRGDREVARLREVYRTYERAKEREGVWDADDVRLAAVRLAEAGRVRGPEAVFVAGFFRLLPLEARFLAALADQGTEVWATRPAPARPRAVRAFRAENPAAELRWALFSILKDIEAGLPASEIALVVPEIRLPQVELLAREYGLYLMREVPRALAETPAGRAALALARFHEHPTPEGLFFFPELRPLAEAALARGLSGRAALAKLAGELGLGPALEAALAALAPGPDLAERVLARLEAEPGEAELLTRLWREALEADPEAPEPWWEALIRAQSLYRPAPLGVALLGPQAAVGRRYRKAYVLSASEGRYRLGEREDYFFPEDCRRAGGLTPRLAGDDRWLHQALLHLGEEVWLSYPETEGGEVLRPEPALFDGCPAEPVPGLFPSRHLRRGGAGYRRELGGLDLPPPRTVGQVRGYAHAGCGLRYLFDRRVPRPREDRARLDPLAEGDPGALAGWGLDPDRWRRLRFWVEVPVDEGLSAWVHAREGNDVHEFAAKAGGRLRWDTVLAYGALGGRVLRWFPGEGARDVTEAAARELPKVRARLRSALARLEGEAARPHPGWACRDCPYLALCREGQR